MRRLFGVLLAGAMLVGPAFSQRAIAQEQQQAATPPLTFNGEIALWSVGVNPDKTGDFEQVVAKLKDALAKSDKPEARQQAAGWKVMRGVTNPQTGQVIYTHVIYPVVKGADYSVMTIIYDVFKDPDEQRQIYELYRGSFGANLGANVGRVVADLGR
jgi:hypothetical protein